MVAHGDEFGRTQCGNNNAYCQDGPLTWVDWRPSRRGEEFADFARRALALRREIGVFGAHRFPDRRDVVWLGSDGDLLSESDWRKAEDRVLGICWRLSPAGVFLVYMNASEEARWVELPDVEFATRWKERLNTATAGAGDLLEGRFELSAQTTIVLQRSE